MKFVKVYDGSWFVPEYYSKVAFLAYGRQGTVCSAKYGNIDIVVKKFEHLMEQEICAKMANRELELLRALKHPNIVEFFDVFTPDNDLQSLTSIYIVTKYAGKNLETFLNERRFFDFHSTKDIVYQILCGLNYIHSANIIHRDLRPSNIAVDDNGRVKILDFDNSRQENHSMTGYVVNRSYRAPEIVFNWQHYTKAVDMWSVACIMAEMRMGQVLFPSENWMEHVAAVIYVCGAPNEDYIKNIQSEETQEYLQRMLQNNGGRENFDNYFQNWNPFERNFLDQVLIYEVDRRLTADSALDDLYFHEVRDQNTRSTYNGTPIDENLNMNAWKSIIWGKITNYHGLIEGWLEANAVFE